jgi:hypothetical protein
MIFRNEHNQFCGKYPVMVHKQYIVQISKFTDTLVLKYIGLEKKLSVHFLSTVPVCIFIAVHFFSSTVQICIFIPMHFFCTIPICIFIPVHFFSIVLIFILNCVTIITREDLI